MTVTGNDNCKLTEAVRRFLYDTADLTGMELFSGAVTLDKGCMEAVIEQNDVSYSGTYRQLVAENKRGSIVRMLCGLISVDDSEMMVMQTIEKQTTVVIVPLELSGQEDNVTVEYTARRGAVSYIRRYYPQLINEADKVELLRLSADCCCDDGAVRNLFASLFLTAVLSGRSVSYYQAVRERNQKKAYYNNKLAEAVMAEPADKEISFTAANQSVFNFGIVMFVLFVIWFIYS